MKHRGPLLKSLILAVAVGSLLLPTLASAAVRVHGGGAHGGGHFGGGGGHFGGRGGGRYAGGGFRGGRGYGGSNWGGGGYGGYCGPIQLTLGLCGPYGL